MVVVLMMGLAVPAFAATSTSAGTSVSTSASNGSHGKSHTSVGGCFAYSENARIANVPIKICAFTTNSSTCSVKVGGSWYTGYITHSKSCGQSVATIRIVTNGTTRRNLNLRLGEPYDVNSGCVTITIQVRFYGSTMSEINMTAAGSYELRSNSQYMVFGCCSTGTRRLTYQAKMGLTGSCSRGWYSASVTVKTDDTGVIYMPSTKLYSVYSSAGYGFSTSYSSNRAYISGTCKVA
jgi:hypothetical protein